MNLIKWSEKSIKKMSVLDFAILKTTVLVFGIIIGGYISGFVMEYIAYLGVLFIILYATLMYRIMKNRKQV